MIIPPLPPTFFHHRDEDEKMSIVEEIKKLIEELRERRLGAPKPIRRYTVQEVILDPTQYPDRVITIDLTKDPLKHVDGIYIDFIKTTANLNNVEFSIDESDWFPATLGISGIEAYGYFFARIRIRWNSSEDNKKIVLVLAGEQTLRFTVTLQSVVIVGDSVGLAKDSTLQSIIQSLITALRATVFIVNNLDQPVTVQLIGCRDPSCTDYVNVGSAFTVNAKSKDARTLTPDTSGWLPYITVQVQCSTAPTTGTLDIYFIRLANDQAKIVSGLAIRDTNVHSFSTDPNNIFIASW